ncbi:LytTR family DNA-binding domain-containing protein [Bradyrhizobium erythrophlei]|uniref:LytTR family DNA-binding domain-containing protein n=1 Tax=Bradyrhizobium erythrophlei TaxID=1437360 RepID=UPI0035E6FFF1
MNDIQNAPESRGVDRVWDQSRTIDDNPEAPGTSGLAAGTSGRDRLTLALVAGLAVVNGLVNALTAAQDAAWRGKPYDLGTPLLWETTSIAVIIALAPAILAGVRRLQAIPARSTQVLFAVAGIGAFAILHIVGMVILRKAVMWMLGGVYDFHVSLTTVLYELRKDVVTCLLIGGGLWLIESRREKQAQPATAAADTMPSVPRMVWLRDGSTRIRLEPRDIISISSAGNYVEYSLADGKNHLIRGTLAAAEAELARFNVARVHRTRLANLNRVTGVEMRPSGDSQLTFDTVQTIQGSRRYRSAVASLERGTASS